MKTYILSILFLTAFLVSSSYAQQGRVFWRGTVDAKIHLVISGHEIETRTISGREYPDGVYSFTSELPQESVVVEVAKKKGRSKKISVIQQPLEENDFTAIVEVNDEGGGSREYQLEIFWR